MVISNKFSKSSALSRRQALGTALAAGVVAASSLPSGAQAAVDKRKPAFVLVHGSWHGSWCFARVIPHLVKAGHAVIAPDLPGHGLNARFPKSYGKRPLDSAAFASEKSPIADITLTDYATAVIAAVDQAAALGNGVILLGHSMGGLPITAVGEAIPEKIKKLVYLTAFMPANGSSVFSYSDSPEAQGAKTGVIVKADPAAVGVLRIDPNSDDPVDIANLKAAFAGDATDMDWDAVRNLLTPDVPLGPFAAPISVKTDRWGKIPRAFIKCLDDYAIRPKLQEKFIALADAFTPNNRTEVHSLNTSHSSFISQPKELADILIGLSA